MSHRVPPTATVMACDVHMKHRFGTNVLGFCAQATIYPLFHFSFFFSLGKAVTLIAAAV